MNDKSGSGRSSHDGPAIDWMAVLERVLIAKPYATPADARRMAPELRDWADKRLVKNLVLMRARLAARREDGG